MAGHLLFNSGSNESSLAPQFKWLDNTFKPFPNIKKHIALNSYHWRMDECKFREDINDVHRTKSRTRVIYSLEELAHF
jgi:hypothetical protein